MTSSPEDDPRDETEASPLFRWLALRGKAATSEDAAALAAARREAPVDAEIANLEQQLLLLRRGRALLPTQALLDRCLRAGEAADEPRRTTASRRRADLALAGGRRSSLAVLVMRLLAVYLGVAAGLGLARMLPVELPQPTVEVPADSDSAR